MLASIGATVAASYKRGTDPWAGSPFAWIRSESSRRRGAIGEQLLAGFLAARGFGVARSKSSEADLLVNQKRAEIKFSTLWEQGTYTFQQIRDQEYDFVIALGISPFDAHCWVMSKTLLKQHVIGRMGQHTGAKGQDTSWMTFRPETPFVWLSGCGGRLRDALTVLRRLAPDV